MSIQINRIDHTAIAVHDLAAGVEHFTKKLGAQVLLQKTLPSIGYTVCYLQWGTDIITVISPDTPENFVTKDLARRGEGLHHMGVEVQDLEQAEAWFVAQGGVVHHHAEVAGVRKEFVVAPKNNCGILLQVMAYEPEFQKFNSSAERYRYLFDHNLISG